MKRKYPDKRTIWTNDGHCYGLEEPAAYYEAQHKFWGRAHKNVLSDIREIELARAQLKCIP